MKKMSVNRQIQKVKNDPKLWLKNFVKIVDNYGNLVPFEVHEAQREFLENMGKFNIISKARQLGFTTLSLGYCLYLACNKPNTNYMIVSYDSGSSKALFEKLKMMNDYLPRDNDKLKKFNLFPSVKRDNRDELLFDNGSRIQCVVSGHKDVGRGSTYEYILLSEFAFYNNQEKLLLGVEQALAKNEESKIVIESTSNGMNHYYNMVSSSAKGNSKYKMFFFPFFHKAYNKLFKFEYDQSETWYKQGTKGYRLAEKDLTKSEKVLFDKGATLRQLMWRQYKLMDMSEQEFAQEYPSTWQESFVSTGNNVFDSAKVIEAMQYVQSPLSRDEVISSGYFDDLKQYIGRNLFIYKLPKRKVKHYGGVDSSAGVGNDYSSISILDADGEQVAQFYHNRIAPYRFSEIVDTLGRIYNYAHMAVEKNSYGLSVLEKLKREYEYENLYKQRVFGKGKRKLELGWYTSATTKPTLIGDLKEMFERDMILIHDTFTLEQMQIFVDVDGKTGNVRGEKNHDDNVISMGLAVQAMKANRYYVDL